VSWSNWLGWKLDGLEFESQWEGERFLCTQNYPDQLWHRPSNLLSGDRGKDKNEWSHTSTPVCLHGMDRDIYSVLYLTQTGSLPMSAEIEGSSRLLYLM